MKKCKICWQPRNHNNPLNAMCKTCTYKKSEQNKKQTRIKQKSPTNKNTPAKFSKETKVEILLRDKSCIFCNSPIQDFHHAYFSNQANYWKDRNNASQWVWICRSCHNACHACKMWSWKRQEAIDYLNNL